MKSRTDVVRARWELWAATFAIIGALVGAVIFFTTSTEPIVDLSIIPSRVVLATALGGMFIAFLLYAIDRERNLHRLAERLVHEQVEHEKLSARLQYLAELTRERDTNAALLEGSADALVVIDQDRVIRRFNPAMERLSGIPAVEAIGLDVCETLFLSDPEGMPLTEAVHPVTLVLSDGEARSGMQVQLTLANGRMRWVSVTFSPIMQDGRVVLILGSLRDIDEQKEQEAMHRDFVSMAAHELRSPLTAIKGFTRTLLSKADQIEEERRVRYLSMVNEQSDRLARLVDDLMQVSRIDAHRLTLEPEHIDVGSLVADIVEQFREKWASREIKLALASDDIPPAWADPHKLGEILINLIDNAIKYSPDDAPVHVGVRPVGDKIQVEIRDFGQGIPRKDLPTLFQKFHRLQASKEADIPGTGLGLYIVKGLVEAHDGRVWVTSSPGEGSIFSFTVPAAQDMLDTIEAVGS